MNMQQLEKVVDGVLRDFNKIDDVPTGPSAPAKTQPAKPEPTTTAIIAREFCDKLLAAIGAGRLAEVVRRNRAETNREICHSHDFYDANMVMMEAMEEHGLDGGNDKYTGLWNGAWDVARAAEFMPRAINDNGEVIQVV